MVLLKNSNNTLPINATTVQKIAVIGAKVNYSVQSRQPGRAARHGGSINCTLDFTTNVRTGDLGSSRVFSDPGQERRARSPASWRRAGARRHRDAAATRASAAAGADFVVVVAGLTPAGRGRGVHGRRRSHERRTTLARRRPRPRSEAEQRRAERPHHGGRGAWASRWWSCSRAAASSTCRWLARVPAVVMAWYPGMVGGTRARQAAVRRRRTQRQAADHLGGERRPTGRRSRTARGTTTMDYYLGYRWFDKNGTALHAGDAAASRSATACRTRRSATATCRCRAATSRKDGVVNVTVDVTNTSAARRRRDRVPVRLVRPTDVDRAGRYKELKALQARQPGGAQPGRSRRGDGHAKRITLPLRVKDLEVLGHGRRTSGRSRAAMVQRHRGAQRRGGQRRAGAARRVCAGGRARLRADRHLQGQLTRR